MFTILDSEVHNAVCGIEDARSKVGVGWTYYGFVRNGFALFFEKSTKAKCTKLAKEIGKRLGVG